jgi:DNA end-binding protein Ku
MAHAIWKGHISFGLITIPVGLFAAARTERVSFNQLHKTCHSRVKQPLFCPQCNRMIERTEIVKGYEYESDQYVLFDEKDFEKVAPQSSRVMEIQEFVKLDEVDPIYLDASYYMVPEEAGAKAYYLLTKTMEDLGYAAVAKLSMHQREHVVIVRPRENGLTLHTMYYPSEIREVADYGKNNGAKPKEQEVKLAQQLVESLITDFQPDKYSDLYATQLKEMIEAKRAGREVAATPEPHRAPVIDLMEALKKSLAQREGASPKKAPARAVTAEAAPEKKVAGMRKKAK